MKKWIVVLRGETPDTFEGDFMPRWDKRFLEGQIDLALGSFMYLDKFKVNSIEEYVTEEEARDMLRDIERTKLKEKDL